MMIVSIATRLEGDSMRYIDGFVIPVPAGNKDKYLAASKKMTSVLKRLGALRVVDCWGDDVPHGKLTDMHMAVKADPSETICLTWIEWPSKQARNEGMAKMMSDPRMKPDVNPMPFDGKRMIYGGFVPVLDTGR